MTSKLELIKNQLSEAYQISFKTEDILDRESVVPHMCDDFSKIIGSISKAEEYIAEGIKGDEQDDCVDSLESAEYELHGVVRQLEELNELVEYLRNWGQSWKDLAKELIDIYDVEITDYSDLYTTFLSEQETK